MVDLSRFQDDHEVDDSQDRESDDEASSPTDGYFNTRQHPHDVYVHDPTITAHAKDLEAAEESQLRDQPTSSNYDERVSSTPDAPSSPTRYTPSSPSRFTPSSPTRSIADENTPLLRPPSLYDVPPPAYSADQSIYGGGQPSYQTISTSEDPAQGTRTGPFFSAREPESMGGLHAEFDPERNLYVRPSTSKRSRLCIRMIKTFFAFLAIALLVWVWAAVFVVDSKDHDGKKGHKDQPTHKEPELPSMPKWPAQCVYGSSKEAVFEFDTVSSFFFDEQIELQELYGGVYGRINLVEAPSTQKSAVRVEISAAPSDPYSVKSLHVQKTSGGISLLTPQIERGDAKSFDSWREPCIIVHASVFAKPGIQLSKLDVSARNLEIMVTSNFNATVDKTQLVTLSSRINCESKLDSRETRIKTTSGSINGHYNLLDLLDMSSQSGSINVDVTPKEASDDKNPAKLQATTQSGSVAVHMPREGSSFADLPDRDYQTLIKTNVGSISGNYIHGSKTELHSQTGSINVAVLPYSAETEGKFSTTVGSGMTSVDLRSPYAGKVIKNMQSSHTTRSGSLHLNYPQEWEGVIKGSTTTGSLTLKGKDVVVSEYDDGWVSKSVKAHKGEGDLEGSLTFETITGSADVTVGDVAGSALRRAVDCELKRDIWRGAPVYEEQ